MAGTPKDRTTPTPGTGAVRAADGRGGTLPGGAGRGYPAGGLPGHSQRGRLSRREQRIPGAVGYPAGGYVRGATGRTWRGGYRGGRIPGGGAIGANRAAVAPTWAATGRGASSGGAGYLCRGVYRAGLFRGAATRQRAAAGGAAAQLPRRGGYPGGLPGGTLAIREGGL